MSSRTPAGPWKHVPATGGAGLALLLCWPVPVQAAPLPPEIVVTANRLPTPALALAGNTATVEEERLTLLNPAHIYEIGTQLPGTWLSRGSGQENLTAIRSPVLTGPGSCGSFLVLEDGIPIRPAGFCNVNELFEVPAEQARAVEVIRGPANAHYGANGLHGTLHVLLPEPGVERALVLGAEAGPDRFLRGRVFWDSGPGDRALTAGLVLDHDGGFRAESGYRQAKGFVRYGRSLAGGELELGFSGSILDQDTAGFITGFEAYKDPVLRLSNPNPESYRQADSQRAHLRFRPLAAGGEPPEWELTVFLRRSRMDFLQHFLLGQPTEENGQDSGGLTLLHYGQLGGARVTAGVDLEYAKGFLLEVQSGPEVGTPPRPTGRHYDYEARQYLAAAYAQLNLPLTERWDLVGGLRLEWLRYDYDNRMIAGNTREDGTPCEPVACLFNRPADRTDNFTNLAPNIGLLYRLNPAASAYLTLTRGFRPPQAAELYRLQAGQNVADLNSETLSSIELGSRFEGGWLRASLAAFWMEKDDYILQDSNRFNVSNGRSRHVGLEAGADLRNAQGFYGGIAGTWARQTYRFSTRIQGGETITSGNDIDTAPRTLGSARAGVDRDRWLAELEWVHLGRYYLTAGEAQAYPGHDLFNFRGALRLDPAWNVFLRVYNLTDRLYADRADFAFGEYRYFPGRDREAFLEVQWRGP